MRQDGAANIVNSAQVRHFVSGYSDAPPSTVGSVLVRDIDSGGHFSAVDRATVHFKAIPDDIIEQLIHEGTVFSCAGAVHTFRDPVTHSHVITDRTPIQKRNLLVLLLT